MFRTLLALAVALTPCCMADAQQCSWQNGRWVCSNNQAARTVTRSYSTPTRTYTRTYRYSQPTVTYSQGSYGATGYGSHGGYAVVQREVAPPAPASDDATGACECGCQETIDALTARVEALEKKVRELDRMLEAKPASLLGPQFGWQTIKGPAFAWSQPSVPATTVAMR